MNRCHIDLVLYRGISELRTEASRAYLGMIWWIVEPMLYVGVFYIVFELGLRRGGDGFVAYLLCGLVTWKWFDGTVRSSANIISMSLGLMHQVYLPKYLLPLSVLVANTIKFWIIFMILCLFLWLNDSLMLGPALWSLPALMFIQLLLILAVGGLAAALVPLVPDLRYVVNYGMTMLFFLSGIFFSLSDMSPEAQALLQFNPMLVLIDAYRAVLLHGAWPEPYPLVRIALASFAVLLLVAALFQRFDRVYPRVVG